MNSANKIYVAGHNGMVGSAFLRALQNDSEYEVITRSRTELDLLDQAATFRFLQETKPDIVVVAAAKVGGIFANNTYRAEFIYENLQVSANIIHGSYLVGVSKLLYLGSSCIYPRLAPQPIKEEYLLTGTLEPTNEWYAIAKIAAIKMCQAYRDQYGASYISVMPTNLYGPNDNFDLESSHVLPALIRKFHLQKLIKNGNFDEVMNDAGRFGNRKNNLPETLAFLESKGISARGVEVWGTGTPRREFMHVDDLVSGCMHVMQHYDGREPVNIGTGEDLTISELAATIRDEINPGCEILWNPEYPDGTPRKLMDNSRITSMGWNWRYSLGQGIGEVYKWYTGQLHNRLSV